MLDSYALIYPAAIAAILLLYGLHLAALSPGRADPPWVVKPTWSQSNTFPGLIHKTFESAAMKTTVGYSVVLPPSYAGGTQRYPVLFSGGLGSEGYYLSPDAGSRRRS